jgi:RNA polymerase sigma-70 factor (ECF subfamily)
MTSPNPATTFEPHRRRLVGLAYRMLGSMSEAEDAVQETYLRWHGADRDGIENPRAFLVTTATRICLDVLKSARARREEYVGPWLPDPVTDVAALAPDAQTELAEDLSIALLLALERLSPLERAAFLLHDVFDFSFGEIANTLERREAAVRQLASRARTRVREARPRGGPVALGSRPAAHAGGSKTPHSIDPAHARLLTAFMQASRAGDTASLTQLLAGDAKIATDGGGKVAAALNVIQGADRVAAFLVGAVRKGWKDDYAVRFETINGLPGIIVTSPDGVVQTNAFEIADGVITAIYVVRNPDKLRHLCVLR